MGEHSSHHVDALVNRLVDLVYLVGLGICSDLAISMDGV